MKTKVALYQSRLKGHIPSSIIRQLQKAQPAFFALPEYFFMQPAKRKPEEQVKYFEENLNYLKIWSKLLPKTVIIGGSFIREKNGKLYNSSAVVLNEEPLGFYQKRKLFGREIGTLATGHDNPVFEHRGIRFAVLICADVFLDENFENLQQEGVDIIFMPTFSPYKKEGIAQKVNRDYNIFVERAKTLNTCIVKVCGVNTPGLEYPIQGRSLIANNDHIIWRAPFHMEHEEILKISSLHLQ